MAKADNLLEEMSVVTIREAVTCIKVLPVELAAMIWGEPGLGKTETIKSAFEKEGYMIVNVLAGQSEPTDIGGIPFNFENRYCKYVVPWWAWMASDAPDVPKEYRGPILLFFDDLPTGSEQTQAAFYKLVHEKYIGEGIRLRDNVRIVAAGNRVDDLSAVVDMPKALCNRFVHYYVKPDVDTWMAWATSKGRIHPHITFYLKRNQQRLSNFEDAKKSTNTHAWASPRTWEMLSKALFALEAAGLRKQQLFEKLAKNKDAANELIKQSDIEYVATQGCIGKLAIDFLTLIKSEFQAIDPEEIIKNPEKCPAPGLEELDKLYATVSNLEHWFSDQKNFKHYKPFLTYALRLPAEFGFLLARLFMTVAVDNPNQKLQEEAFESDHFQKVSDKWGNVSLSVY